MKYAIFIAVILPMAFSGGAWATVVNSGKPIFCARAQVTAVRIEGCDTEPCSIQKGATVPYEIDLSFQTPTTPTEDISTRVFINYWGTTAVYGSYIGEGSGCQELQTSECPVNPGTPYTIHSNIWIDPESKDSLSGATTGSKTTNWSLNVNGADQNEYSTCQFNVEINIVE